MQCCSSLQVTITGSVMNRQWDDPARGGKQAPSLYLLWLLRDDGAGGCGGAVLDYDFGNNPGIVRARSADGHTQVAVQGVWHCSCAETP